MELGMPTARLTCSIDGPRRAIDGSQSPIDGAQGAIDGIRSVIDGARSVIDGALKAIDRAPVLDRWDSEPGRWGSEHAARPRPGRAGPRAVPRSLSRGGVRVGSRLHPADRGTGGAPGRVRGRAPRPAPRTKSVQRTSASPSRAWNDASALSRFCARARATFAALQPLRASFRASSPSSDPRERDCPSGASQSQWPSVVRKYDSPASNWPSTDGLGKRWNCRPCARAIASSTGIGAVTGSMAVTNRHMDAV